MHSGRDLFLELPPPRRWPRSTDLVQLGVRARAAAGRRRGIQDQERRRVHRKLKLAHGIGSRNPLHREEDFRLVDQDIFRDRRRGRSSQPACRIRIRADHDSRQRRPAVRHRPGSPLHPPCDDVRHLRRLPAGRLRLLAHRPHLAAGGKPFIHVGYLHVGYLHLGYLQCKSP